jgi:hypothetical protein
VGYVSIPKEAFEGIVALRAHRDLNMTQLVPCLQYLERCGYKAATDWISDNIEDYFQGLRAGFTPTDEVVGEKDWTGRWIP